MLGTNSYELYTLEKVVEKVLMQVQHLTSDSSQQTGARLLALYEYEHVRARVCHESTDPIWCSAQGVTGRAASSSAECNLASL
jgi:hypothetical protein